MNPGVGFDVPEGTPSRASFIEQPQPIRKQFRPWGADGNDTTGEFSPPDSAAYRKFVENFWGLFGKLRADKQIPSGLGLPESPADHWPQWQGYLRAIAEYNPAFLKTHGYGEATGNLEPTREEIFRAWMAGGGVGDAIQREGTRLNLLHGGASTAAIPRPEDYELAADYQSDFALYLTGQPIKGAAWYRNQRAGADPGEPPPPPPPPPPPSDNPPPPAVLATDQKLDSIMVSLQAVGAAVSVLLQADGSALSALSDRLSAIEAHFAESEEAIVAKEREWWIAELGKLSDQFSNRPAMDRALRELMERRQEVKP